MTIRIANYKKWRKVNPTPHMMRSNLAGLCRGAIAKELAKEAENSHLNNLSKSVILHDKYATVYVNPIAKKAMLTEKHSKFPEGSIIIKEKFDQTNSATPELLTVMFKRENGYDPTSGNWEYAVLSGDGTQLHSVGKLKNCRECHLNWKNNDFVSRNYLPKFWKDK